MHMLTQLGWSCNVADKLQELSPEPVAGEATAAENAPSSSSPQENLSASPPPSAGALKGIAPAIRCVGFILPVHVHDLQRYEADRAEKQYWMQ